MTLQKKVPQPPLEAESMTIDISEEVADEIYELAEDTNETGKESEEIETIETRFHIIREEHVVPITKKVQILGGISFEDQKLIDASSEELNAYKVRLENILCQTDQKEKDYSLLVTVMLLIFR